VVLKLCWVSNPVVSDEIPRLLKCVPVIVRNRGDDADEISCTVTVKNRDLILSTAEPPSSVVHRAKQPFRARPTQLGGTRGEPRELWSETVRLRRTQAADYPASSICHML
jgi:hypothetical protein